MTFTTVNLIRCPFCDTLIVIIESITLTEEGILFETEVLHG